VATIEQEFGSEDGKIQRAFEKQRYNVRHYDYQSIEN